MGPQLPCARPREQVCIDDALHFLIVEQSDARASFQGHEQSISYFCRNSPNFMDDVEGDNSSSLCRILRRGARTSFSMT